MTGRVADRLPHVRCWPAAARPVPLGVRPPAPTREQSVTTEAFVNIPTEAPFEEELESDLQELPTFADLGVQAPIVQALAGVGITHPFPIQAMTLPVALTGHDIIGQAKTGTGKTLGFGIPLLQRVVAPGEEGFDALEAPGKPQALVVVPTRELAVQVAGDLATAGKLR